MGIFDALTTSVGGLQAQSFALQNISGNIANTSTIGYKGIGTSFEDLVPNAGSASTQVAGGVTASSQSTITSQGTVSSTTVATNMAINGDGFFSVQQPTGIVDNVPTFSGVTDYTRRGDFQLNANGNLVNGAGYYLMGEAVDPKTGNVTGNVPTVLQFQNNFIPAQTTTTINYAANLPSTPTTAISSSSASGTITAAGGLDPLAFTVNPTLTAASGFANATVTGIAGTLSSGTMSGSTPLSSLTTNFSAVTPDTITVDGQTLTFVSGVASGANQVSVNDDVATLLSKIDGLSGATAAGFASSVNSSTGKITLSTGTASSLSISGGTGNATTALTALGIATGSGITYPVTRTTVNRPVTLQTNQAGASEIGVNANDNQTFLNQSISGGAVTTYDQTGNSVNLELRWAQTDSVALGAGHTNTWNLFYQNNSSATGTQLEWTNVGQNFTFSSTGAMTNPTTPAITISGIQVGTQTLGTSVSFNVASGSLTQYASAGGNATINTVTQNGYAAGQLQSVAINNNGLVVGTFSNGQNLDLASVTLSHFNGTNYLQALNGDAYAANQQSGTAIIGASGTISGSSLEGSNTDIASEFTKLIVTQQAYSANTKVITTANSMVQDLLNVLR
jgi:flagellar hook protein FlgE